MTSVLIGSSALSNPRHGVCARERTDDIRNSGANLRGVLQDVMSVYSVFLDVVKIEIGRMFVDTSPKNVNRANVLEALADAFAAGADVVAVYYAGHGHAKQGTWCFHDLAGELSLIDHVEVSAMWVHRSMRRPGQKLYIIMDSCYSGHWQDLANGEDVFVKTSCARNAVCKENRGGGIWTQAWVADVSTRCSSLDEQTRAMVFHALISSSDTRAEPTCPAVETCGKFSWKVVPKAGLVVRMGPSEASRKKYPLPAGTLIAEVRRQDGFMLFEKMVVNSGPHKGWINVQEGFPDKLAASIDVPPNVVVLYHLRISDDVLEKGLADPFFHSRFIEACGVLGWKRPADVFCHPDHLMLNIVALTAEWDALQTTKPGGPLILFAVGPLEMLAALCVAGALSFEAVLCAAWEIGILLQHASALFALQVNAVNYLRQEVEHLCFRASQAAGPGHVCFVSDTILETFHWIEGTHKAISILLQISSESRHGKLEMTEFQGAGAAGAVHEQEILAIMERATLAMKPLTHKIYLSGVLQPLSLEMPVQQLVRTVNTYWQQPVHFHNTFAAVIDAECPGAFYVLGHSQLMSDALRGISIEAHKALKDFKELEG